MTPVTVLSVIILVLFLILNLRIYEMTVKTFDNIAAMIEMHIKINELTVKFYEGYKAGLKEVE